MGPVPRLRLAAALMLEPEHQRGRAEASLPPSRVLGRRGHEGTGGHLTAAGVLRAGVAPEVGQHGRTEEHKDKDAGVRARINQRFCSCGAARRRTAPACSRSADRLDSVFCVGSPVQLRCTHVEVLRVATMIAPGKRWRHERRQRIPLRASTLPWPTDNIKQTNIHKLHVD